MSQLFASGGQENEKAHLKLNIPKTKIMASGPITTWQIDGETMETVTDFLFLGSKISVDGDCSHKIKRCLLLGRKAMINLDSIFKSRDITDKDLSSQSCGFSSSHVWMWELDNKKDWVPKNWCFWTVVLEKILESPLDCKEIQPVSPKGNQQWIFIGRTDAEAEAPVLWPPDAKSWLIGKDPDAGKDWEGRGWQRMRWLNGIIDSMGVNLSKLWEMVKDRGAWRVDIYSILSLWPLLLLVVNTHYSNGVDLLRSVEGQVESNGDWEGENIVSNMWE